MIFQHTHHWITGVSPHTGAPKTATSRPEPKPRHKVGDVRAVQPGRGKHAVAKIRITNAAPKRPRDLTPDEVRREGFSRIEDYWTIYAKMHGARAIDEPCTFYEFEVTSDGKGPS